MDVREVESQLADSIAAAAFLAVQDCFGSGATRPRFRGFHETDLEFLDPLHLVRCRGHALIHVAHRHIVIEISEVECIEHGVDPDELTETHALIAATRDAIEEFDLVMTIRFDHVVA